MEAPRLYLELRNKFGQAILNWTDLAPNNIPVVWVDGRSLQAVVRAVLADPSFGYGWVENLSAGDVDGSLMLTYCLASWQGAERMVVRVSLRPIAQDAIVEIPSLKDILKSVEPFEEEIARTFGVRFVGGMPNIPEGCFMRKPVGVGLNGHA